MWKMMSLLAGPMMMTAEAATEVYEAMDSDDDHDQVVEDDDGEGEGDEEIEMVGAEDVAAGDDVDMGEDALMRC